MPLRRTPGHGRWRHGARFLVSAACALAVLGLFLVGFVVGTALGSLPSPQPFRSQGQPSLPPDAGPGGAPGGPAVTAEQTLLIFSTVYEGCGCVLEEARTAGHEYAGIPRDELEACFPGWRLQDFGPLEVIFFRLEEGLCPDMQTFRTIGLHNGGVAVFLGRPSTGLLLHRLTGIPASVLSSGDHERLEAGIVVKGDEAVERHLEGLRD